MRINFLPCLSVLLPFFFSLCLFLCTYIPCLYYRLSPRSLTTDTVYKRVSVDRILQRRNPNPGFCRHCPFICFTLDVYVSLFPYLHVFSPLLSVRPHVSSSPSILSTSLFCQKLRQSPKETQVMPGLCKRHSGETRICSSAFKLFR